MSTARSDRGRESLRVRRLVYAALYLAIALVLPFVTGRIPQIAKALSPMHIPVLLCGFMCGWPWGAVIGFIAPLLSSVLFGMPTIFPDGVAMAFELAVYGCVSGIFYALLPRRPRSVYVSLVVAMLTGRLVWGIVTAWLLGMTGETFTLDLFLAGAFVNAVPGIVLHIALIPILVISMERAGLSLLPKE